MTSIYLIVLVLVLLLVRNHLVFSIRRRRLNKIHETNLKSIDRLSEAQLRDAPDLIEKRYADMESLSYEAMLFDLRRWTYKQFYPEEVK